MEITEKLKSLQRDVTRATQAANRTPDSVTIVAVTKGQPLEAVQAAIAAGVGHFGENYLQEALPKVVAIGDGPAWHFIGALQANKTRAVAERFQWVHTVTSAHLAGRLSRARPHYAGDLQVCIQLRPAATASAALPAAARSGASEGEIAGLAHAILALPRLRLRGIMFMPRGDLAPTELRAEFRRARWVFDELRRTAPDVDTLSMGMSGDFAEAIAAGSTLIRVGTAIFGERVTDQRHES